MGAEDVPSGVEAAGEAEQATTHQMAGDEADPHRAQDAGARLRGNLAAGGAGGCRPAAAAERPLIKTPNTSRRNASIV